MAKICFYTSCAGRSSAFREEWKKRNGQGAYYLWHCPKTANREEWLRHLPEDLKSLKSYDFDKHGFCALHFEENDIVKKNIYEMEGKTYSYDLSKWRLAPNAVPKIFKGTNMKTWRLSKVAEEVDLTDEIKKTDSAKKVNDSSKPDPSNKNGGSSSSQTAQQTEIVDVEDEDQTSEILEITPVNPTSRTSKPATTTTSNVTGDGGRINAPELENVKPRPPKRQYNGKLIHIAPKPCIIGPSIPNPMLSTPVFPLINKYGAKLQKPNGNATLVKISPKPGLIVPLIVPRPIHLDNPGSSRPSEMKLNGDERRPVSIVPKPVVDLEDDDTDPTEVPLAIEPCRSSRTRKPNPRVYSVSDEEDEESESNKPDPISNGDAEILEVDPEPVEPLRQHPLISRRSISAPTNLVISENDKSIQSTATAAAISRPPAVSGEIMSTLTTPSQDWSVNNYVPNGCDQIFAISETVLGKTNIEIVRKSITVDLTKTKESPITLTFSVFAHEIPKMNIPHSSGPYGDDEAENFQNIQSALNEFGALPICEGLGETRKALEEIRPTLISKSADHCIRSTACTFVIFKSAGADSEDGSPSRSRIQIKKPETTTRCESCAEIYQCLLLRYSGVKIPSRLRHLLVSESENK